MPLGRSYFTRDGFDLQNGNCFACHAGVASGIVIAGLANTHLDQTSGLASAEALLKIDDTLKTDAKLTQSDEAEEELKAYLENIDMTVRATFKFAEARGDNLGPYAVWRRLSRLTDPVGLGLVFHGPDDAAPLDPLFEAQHLTTVDPLPWWLRKYRTVQYWFSETTPGVAAHFAFNFTVPHNNTNDHHEEHVAAIDRILTFAQHTTSPAFPAQLNPANVQYGAALYHGETALADGSTLGCADCHGNYKKIGDDWATPGDWSVDYQDGELLDVGTDMAYSQILLAFPPIAEHGNGLTQYFNNLGKPNIAPQTNIPLKAGYLAPPAGRHLGLCPVLPQRQRADPPPGPRLHDPRPPVAARQHRPVRLRLRRDRPRPHPRRHDRSPVRRPRRPALRPRPPRPPARRPPRDLPDPPHRQEQRRPHLRRRDERGGALRHDRLPAQPQRRTHAASVRARSRGDIAYRR
jgi:hypothetical protein